MSFEHADGFFSLFNLSFYFICFLVVLRCHALLRLYFFIVLSDKEEVLLADLTNEVVNVSSRNRNLLLHAVSSGLKLSLIKNLTSVATVFSLSHED